MKFADVRLTKRERQDVARGQTDVLRGWHEQVLKGKTPPFAVIYSWAAIFREEWTANRDILEAFHIHLRAQAETGTDNAESEKAIRALFAKSDIRDCIRFPMRAGGRWIPLPLPRDDQTEAQYFRAFLLSCLVSWLELVSPQCKNGRIRVAVCDSCGGVFFDSTRGASARFCHANCRMRWHRSNAAITKGERTVRT